MFASKIRPLPGPLLPPPKKTLEIFFFPRAAFCPSPPLPPRNLEEKSHRALLGSSKDLEKARFPLWSRRNRAARSRVNILALGGRCWGSPFLGPSPPPGGWRWAAPPPPPSRLWLLVQPGCGVNRGFPMQISLLTPSKQRLMRPLHCSINTQSLAAEKYTHTHTHKQRARAAKVG